MMGVDHLGLFVVAGLLLNLTPGPDVLFIVTRALKSGARAGMVAALGIAAGCCVHILAAAVGVSALVAASATAFAVLKWLVAAYLVYVGLSMLLARRARESGPVVLAPDAVALRPGLGRLFLQGFWTNALNPKVALFFLAFVPQFIAPGAGDPTLAFLGLGALFNLNGLLVNFGWALLAAWLAGRLGSLRHGLAGLQRVAGALFIGFGLKLALSDAPVPSR
ncbi:LysE family translocator [Ramlibacter sp. 2FC]|uniref:LysE family translocator n=1 Tax=Ramlibacter sp. 2FC TaxID=2502188 RepID=UPI0010F65DA3|nr:LysE family translocator [Ramlibacter sp. 2FC]